MYTKKKTNKSNKLTPLGVEGGYFPALGIYGCAALMGGFVNRFAPMIDAFVEVLPPLGVKKEWHISFKICPIFANYGWGFCKFCTYDG